MEPSDWLNGFATQEVLDYALEYFTAGEDEPVLAEIQNSVVLQADPDFRATAGEEIMLRKNFRAAGAWDGADRSVALDHLGFATLHEETNSEQGVIEAMVGPQSRSRKPETPIAAG